MRRLGAIQAKNAHKTYEEGKNLTALWKTFRDLFIGAPQINAGRTQRIPSLDGLRALSICVVLLAHSSWMINPLVASSSVFRYVVGNGMHGVAVFFVISGYLITTLLLREVNDTGRVSLPAFYRRRTLRIFPPFYVFLIVMALLWHFRVITLDLQSFIAAITYTWAINPHVGAPLLTHSWSLSIEEFFYLVWPLAFIVLHRRRKMLNYTLGMIVLFPLIRIALYFVAHGLRGHEFYMLQGWSDTMLFGCLLAQLRARRSFETWHNNHLKGWMVFVLAGIAFYWSKLILAHLLGHVAGFYALAIDPTLVAITCGAIVLYVTTRTKSLVARFLDLRLIRHIGLLSYGLYLWQQLFMAHQFHLGGWRYVCALAAAEGSFWLVERPIMRWRRTVPRTSPTTTPLTPTSLTEPSSSTL